MKGPAESGEICSVEVEKIAKKIAKNKRCYANTLRPRSRMLLKGDEGGLAGHYPLGHLRRGGGSISALRVTGDPAKGDPGGGTPPHPPQPLFSRFRRTLSTFSTVGFAIFATATPLKEPVRSAFQSGWHSSSARGRGAGSSSSASSSFACLWRNCALRFR
jgi:hypothetical protein